MALNDNQKKKKVLLEDLETFHDGMIKELDDKGVYYMPVNGIPTTDLSNGAVSIAKTKRKIIDLTVIPTILEGSRLDLDDSDIINMFQGVTDASSLYSNYVAQNDSFLEVSSDTSTQLTNCVIWGDENNFGLNFNCVLDGMTLFLQVEYRNNTLGGYIESSVKKALKEITYNDLVSLKTQNKLIPGTLYRITDYITTTAAEYTQSAGHAFDVVVLALDSSTLDCNAMAIQHEGDTYFNSADLSKWELKYDINNDTSKYTWADATNGKGVIYWMRDEHAIECPYDFKNIKFIRFANVEHAFHVPTSANAVMSSIKSNLITLESVSGDTPRVMTFAPDSFSGVITYYNDHASELSGLTFADGFQFLSGHYYKILFAKTAATLTDCIVAEVDQAGQAFYTFDINGADATIASGKNIGYVKIGDIFENGKRVLPNNVFTTSGTSVNSLRNNILNNCNYNTFGMNTNFTDSTVMRATGCALGRLSYTTVNIMESVIGNYVLYSDVRYIQNSTCGNLSYSRIDTLQRGSIVNSKSINIEGQSSNIILATGCNSLDFGENCASITLGQNCVSISFGANCANIIAGNNIKGSSFGVDCNNIIIGQDASNVQDYAQAIEVDATTSYVNIYSTTATSSTTYLKRIVVKNSASGTSTTPKDITTTADNSYITTFRGANDIDLVV